MPEKLDRRGFLKYAFIAGGGLIISALSSGCVPETPHVIPVDKRIKELGWNQVLKEQGEIVEAKMAELGLTPGWHPLVNSNQLQEDQRWQMNIPQDGYFSHKLETSRMGRKGFVARFVWVDDKEVYHFQSIPESLIKITPPESDMDTISPAVKFEFTDLSKFIVYHRGQIQYDERRNQRITIDSYFEIYEYPDLSYYLPSSLDDLEEKRRNSFVKVYIKGDRNLVGMFLKP